MKKNNLSIILLVLTLVPQLLWGRQRIAPSDEYLSELQQELAQFLAPSVFYWPVLVVSFAVVFAMVLCMAQRKGIPITSASFLFPACGFLIFLFLFTTLHTMLARLIVEMAGWAGDFLVWAKPPFLLGTEWYGGAVLSVAWFGSHPLVLRRSDTTRTSCMALMQYLPSAVLAGAVLLWLWIGFVVGFL